MCGSYLDELKEFEDKHKDLESIELHFLSKDAQEIKKVLWLKKHRYNKSYVRRK